jgi:hypothetical protein
MYDDEGFLVLMMVILHKYMILCSGVKITPVSPIPIQRAYACSGRSDRSEVRGFLLGAVGT